MRQREHPLRAGTMAAIMAVVCAAALLPRPLPALGNGSAGPPHVPANRLERMTLNERFREPPGTASVNEFTAYGGEWTVKDGEVHVPGGPGPKLLRNGPAFSAGEVGVEILLPDKAGGNAGLIVKVSDPGVGADRFNGYEVSLDAAGQCLRLGRHRQNFEHIRDVPCAVPVGQWVPLVVRMTRDTLEVTVGGKRVIAYTDTEHPLVKGTVGFRPWQREARFRRFWILTDGRRQDVPLEAAQASDQVVGRWQAVRRGSARAAFGIDSGGVSPEGWTQRLTFLQGRGEVGIAHAGPDGAGVPFVAGKAYQGTVRARAEEATDLFVSAEGADGRGLAERRLRVEPGGWQAFGFTLTPTGDAEAGRLALTLKAPGRVQVGWVSLAPGDWAWPGRLALRDLPPIAFIARHPLTRPNAVGCDIWQAQPHAPGCSIQVVDPARPERGAKTLFSDPGGSIYDMNVSPDARTLLFSYRRKEERHWHLWRIGTDRTGLEQLTRGPHHDVSPCFLPGGDILLVSTRRGGYTVCQPGPASNLYRMAPDGSGLRCVSMNTLSDFNPHVLPDGRVLFTRWEYVDRDLTYRQSLWTQNPDGTMYQLYFGNTIRDVGSFLQARPLPGSSEQVVATFAPHHGFPHGAIGLIDQRYGLEGPRGQGFVYLTREFGSIGDRAHEWSYRDPFPLTDETFLCAYGGGVERYRIVLLDVTGRRRTVYENPAIGCYVPLPLEPRPEPPLRSSPLPARQPDPPPVREPEPADTVPTGTFMLVDVYQGMEPTIRRGQAKYLRVMEQIRKSEDLHNRAYDQSPVMSYGTYYAKRSWGTVPLEADGSAYFRAPALREIYFQVLDADGRELQRMTSAAQLMPDETVSCIGCHEPRSAVPAAGPVPLAARRPPVDLTPPPWGNDGIVDFVKVVQPVLDRYCTECHRGPNPDGGYDLSGDTTRLFNMAYDNLLGRSRSYRQHDMAAGHMLPDERAKGKPLVHFYWLLRTPTAVNQPLWTGSHASRLLEYIEADHCGRVIPLADRQRLYTWMDANVPYYGTYANTRPASPGKRDLCTDVATGRPAAWFADGFLEVFNRRCASCHGSYPHPNDHGNIWDGRLAWINFTHPSHSPALAAHLAADAGGRGVGTEEDGKGPALFAGTEDADYRAMLGAIRRGRKDMLAHPRVDMQKAQQTASGDRRAIEVP